jgi:protein-tyrosine phosphatase
MDHANLRTLVGMRPPAHAGHLGLYLDLLPDAGIREMPDPYYGGPEGFERVLDLAERVTPALVAKLAGAMRR